MHDRRTHTRLASSWNVGVCHQETYFQTQIMNISLGRRVATSRQMETCDYPVMRPDPAIEFEQEPGDKNVHLLVESEPCWHGVFGTDWSPETFVKPTAIDAFKRSHVAGKPFRHVKKGFDYAIFEPEHH